MAVGPHVQFAQGLQINVTALAQERSGGGGLKKHVRAGARAEEGA
jgi:hypothetical protein